ncbi:MAG: hypothetical protein QW112_01935 [Candidatus Micrarchaeia archaeon]
MEQLELNFGIVDARPATKKLNKRQSFGIAFRGFSNLKPLFDVIEKACGKDSYATAVVENIDEIKKELSKNRKG